MSEQEAQLDREACPRCTVGVLVYDDEEGFLLCPNCGFVAEEEEALQHQPHEGGAWLASDGTAPRRDGAEPGALSRAGGRSRSGAALAQERVYVLAGSVQMAQRYVREACDVVQQMYQWRSVHTSYARSHDGFAAAALLYVARVNRQPVCLRDMASAAQMPRASVACFYRRLCAAMGAADGAAAPENWLVRPSLSVRALCLRHAAELLRTGLGRCGSEVDIRAHPFVKAALSLADLVHKAGIGEGRAPAIMAGAVLILLSEPGAGLYPGGRLRVHDVAVMVGCGQHPMNDARSVLQDQLLKLAALLPLGALITGKNLPAYIPLIVSATHTIIALKRKGQDAAGAEPDPSAPSAALTGTLPLPGPAVDGTASDAVVSQGQAQALEGAAEGVLIGEGEGSRGQLERSGQARVSGAAVLPGRRGLRENGAEAQPLAKRARRDAQQPGG